MVRRKFAYLAVAGLALVTTAMPSRGFFGGASEFTQLLNNAELVALAGQSGIQIDNQLVQIGHQVEQIQNQLRIYQNLLQNTERLPTAIWGEIESDLAQLEAIVRQGDALAFSMANIDQVLRDRFASYGEQVANPLAGEDFGASYEQWSQTNRDTIAGTLAAANVTSTQLSSEESVMAQLRALSGTAMGQMQALQLGHQLAGQEVAQVQKLRALVSQQMVMTGTWYQSEQAARDLAQSRRERFFSTEEDYPITGLPDMEPRW